MVKYPTTPKSRCYAICDASLITVHVSGCCWFSDINISPGSVATRLSYGGIFYYRFARNLPLSLSVKERAVKIDQHMAEIRGKKCCGIFSRTRCRLD